MSIYGYVNGEPVSCRDEFIYRKRGFGEIGTDERLLEYAEKVTWGWQKHGWKRKFTDFYLSDYALDEPYKSLTHTEFQRLKDMQARIRAEEKAADEARGWELVETRYWADNSVDRLWRAKDGGEKIVVIEHAHGDAC